MGRIIKFRGKAIADGSWVYGDLVQTQDKKTAIWPTGSENHNGIVEVYPESIGQYTNIRDCKKNEIYEGDIVRQTWKTTIIDEYDDSHTASGTQTGIVAIRTKGVCISPCLTINDFNGESTLTRNKSLSGYRCEVIGNIHDDPKMFKTISMT